MKCELCSFNNPKCAVTAIVIKDNRLLLLKRNEEPNKGMWDLPGGYVNYLETLEDAMRRELEEELGQDQKLSRTRLTPIGSFPGTSMWKGESFAVMNFAYLAEIDQPIKLDHENSEYSWVELGKLDHNTLAFDSNVDIVRQVKKDMTFDLNRVKELMWQLDASETLDEQRLYRAVLDGHLEKIMEDGKLVGLGWIYPRQTMLRKQAVVEDMIVDEACRGKGYGKQMLLELIKWTKGEDVGVIELTTNPLRVAANALYQKVGFKKHETNHYLFKNNGQ